ncbi:Predicted alpha-1,6-mannanase, GH76 family [Amycolatopsis arida]|uniref:Predicted alpha-1,6-mannanase, GH76 family n=1 Tax=Amycolatopsis arida TaxID=587909 RepID=A0A1I5T6E7_9PSEU|nr:glycoside hydrolase family 76 protein [Amycolatopsis arida]TDX96213.1 putative alpha-1,6-mannanase (GH76 family) [Amycolatopsis arida]SFP78583.1 Predicted alpha-1,6-mannanase, GH76 family [Amycolatopsis arida]
MTWAERAGRAEAAVAERHLRRLWGLPGTVLGRSGWPPTPGELWHRPWNYWWQAHLLDCLVDAELRAPAADRRRTIRRLARSVWLRNRCGWRNDYFDDMAWLALALQRAGAVTGRRWRAALRVLLDELRGAWTPDAGGGIWWRRGDDFKNAPANGPAAIAHARAGELDRAAAILGWLEATLVDPVTGLVWDGVRAGSGELERQVYTYCQGVFLGACLELSGVDGSAVGRAERTVVAVAGHCAPGGVLRGQDGGDGGLFAGILARYLALAVPRLPDPAAATARELVLGSAEACWSGATDAPGGPLFGAEWAEPAPSLPAVATDPARDLSVQVGAWMLLEAAATMTRG